MLSLLVAFGVLKVDHDKGVLVPTVELYKILASGAEPTEV
jgi:hypothetical protein